MRNVNKNIFIKIFLIVMVIVGIYKIFLENNIHFEYLKYYEGLWYYVPTDEEKEFIVYMGERDYECEFVFDVDDYIFSRYDELDNQVGIYCDKEINGNTYDVENTIKINIVDGEYYISMLFSVILKESESNEEIIDYSRYYSPYYEYIKSEIYTEDKIYLNIGRNSCIVSDSNASIVEEYLLNTKEITDDGDIYIRKPENDDEDSVEENIASCNDILDAGYGEAMFYDVILPFENELRDIKDYGEKILN